MSRALILLALPGLAGCRLGFDDYFGSSGRQDAGGDAMIGDASLVDTPADAAVTQVVIGERGTLFTSQNTFDTTLDQFMPNLTGGAVEDVALTGSVGAVDWALLRFDLVSIPPGSTVTAARVELVTVATPDLIAGQIAVYPLVAAWDESTATWNERSAGVPWSVPGGARGGEIARFTPAGSFSFSVPAAIVQSWVDTPGANLGLAIGAVDTLNDTHYHFHSRESVDLASRPQIVIDLLQ